MAYQYDDEFKERATKLMGLICRDSKSVQGGMALMADFFVVDGEFMYDVVCAVMEIDPHSKLTEGYRSLLEIYKIQAGFPETSSKEECARSIMEGVEQGIKDLIARRKPDVRHL